LAAFSRVADGHWSRREIYIGASVALRRVPEEMRVSVAIGYVNGIAELLGINRNADHVGQDKETAKKEILKLDAEVISTVLGLKEKKTKFAVTLAILRGYDAQWSARLMYEIESLRRDEGGRSGTPDTAEYTAMAKRAKAWLKASGYQGGLAEKFLQTLRVWGVLPPNVKRLPEVEFLDSLAGVSRKRAKG